MTGIELIAAERTRQIEKEKYSADHDDEHARGEILLAGIAYATAAQRQGMSSRPDLESVLQMYWPWDGRSWKPKGRRENLVKAAALIAAEIDRDIRQNG